MFECNFERRSMGFRARPRTWDAEMVERRRRIARARAKVAIAPPPKPIRASAELEKNMTASTESVRDSSGHSAGEARRARG